MKKWFHSNTAQQIVFIGPAFIVYVLIVGVPFLLSLYYAFTDWNGVSGIVKWVGLENFITIFTNDPNFLNSFWFTTRFTIIAVVLMNLIGFTLAYFLSKPLKLRNIFRTVYFMPYVLGGVLLGFIWQFIFVQGFPAIGKLSEIGVFNLPWLGTEKTAFWGLIIVFLWHGAGYLMVIYIAGLVNVPNELIEAATIDGATSWQVLKEVIIPLLRPIITICLFLSLAWAFKIFDLNFSLTKGGPFNSTESVAMNIYTEAFTNNRYGLGTAKALIFFIVVSIITFVQFSIMRKKEVNM